MGLLLLGCSVAAGDTLLLNDGRRLEGRVSLNDGQYTIEMKLGKMSYYADEVRQWIRQSDAPDPTPSTKVAARSGQPAPAGVSITPAQATDLSQTLHQGGQALASGHDAEAIKAFDLVLKLDGDNLAALAGAGLAQVRQGRVAQGRNLMEAAWRIDGADSALAVNLAASQLASRQSARAVKLLSDYLKAHDDAGETLVNALAAALANCEAGFKHSRDFAAARTIYLKASSALELQRPGEKRWGIQWLSAAEVDQRNAEMVRIGKLITALEQDSDRAQQQVRQAEMAVKQASMGMIGNRAARRNELQAAQNRAQRELQAAQGKLDAVHEQLQETHNKIQRPTFPDHIELVDLDPKLFERPVAQAAAKPASAPSYPEVAATEESPVESTAGLDDFTFASDKPPALDKASDSSQPAADQSAVLNVAAFAVAPDLLLAPEQIAEGNGKLDVQFPNGSGDSATVVRRGGGMALLKLSRKKVAYFDLAEDFAGGKIVCATLNRSAVFNQAASLLNGEAEKPAGEWTVKLSDSPGLPGGPLLDEKNMLVGMAIAAKADSARRTPALSLQLLKTFLGKDRPINSGGNPEPAQAVFLVTRQPQ